MPSAVSTLSVTRPTGWVESWYINSFGILPVVGSEPAAKETRVPSATVAKVSYERAASASHTIPVTVAAEQGVIGLLAYLALLVLAFIRALRGARSAPWPEMQVGVAAAFTAVVVHTLIYAAFLEDPLTWVLLGVATALAAARSQEQDESSSS